MKRVSKLCAAVLALTLALALPASAAADFRGPHASPAQRVAWGEEEQGSGASSARQGGVSRADFAPTSYPTAVTRSEDGTTIRKVYDLSPEEDPAGIPRSDFEQDGYHYTLTDLLRQEAPEYEERFHTETVSVASRSKDMAAVLALLPQVREFVTEDGLAGSLTLQLDTVNVEVSGYGSSSKEITASRTYPGLANQDTQYIPKTIEEDGSTLTLQAIDWQAGDDGHFTAAATYTGTATSRYVKGYTVTADYVGTVSRIVLNKVRYVAIFEGTALAPPEPEPPVIQPPEPDPDVAETPAAGFNWAFLLIPLGLVAAAGGGIGIALLLKRREEGAA